MTHAFDIVVVGAGPAGLAAASVAAEAGRQVALIDDTPWLGGQIWRGEQRHASNPEAQKWIRRFVKSGAILLERTSIVSAPSNRVLQGEQPDGSVSIHWNKLILATGARELFLPFPGWTLPGVFGPGGLQALVKNGWPIRGKRVVISGSGPLLLAVADGLRKAGANVALIAEQAAFGRIVAFGSTLLNHPGKLLQGAGIRARTRSVRYRFNTWVTRAEGNDTVRSVTLTDGKRTWFEPCDALACGFGLVPNTELPQLLGCALKNDFVDVDQHQQSSVPSIYCAGEITGIGGADAALVEGQIAALAATGRIFEAEALLRSRTAWSSFQEAMAKAFALRPEVLSLSDDNTLLCRCEDVTLGRARQFTGWRDAKLQSRCGMGSCQGRICGAAARHILKWNPESVRPPVLPARVETLIENQL